MLAKMRLPGKAGTALPGIRRLADLIAAQLEKSWEASLQRVKACEARLDGLTPTASVQAPDLSGLANDLEAAWNAPGVTMRSRQQLLRALVTDIIADIDESTREVILTIHWR